MQLTSTHEINATADAVWDVMGERFADIGEWSDTVIASSLDGPLQEGAVRTCELKPTPAASGTIKERITKFDRAGKSFAFDIVDGLPGFMRRVNSEWTIRSLGGPRTQAVNTLTIEVAWWMRPMLPMIRKQFAQTIKSFIPQIEAAAKPGMGHVETMAAAG